jgi:glycosyltransferase involved in cell wall biosynthesis
MRLLIISHTPHYLRDGAIVGWGATVREIDELATLFNSVVHIAPLYSDDALGSALPYRSPRVRLHAVPPAGGERLRDKLSIPLRYPGYVRAILQERTRADIIHVRSPANISLLALVMLAFLREPQVRWAKYAGDWGRGNAEPWSYRFQRWWLARGFCRGVVTVNGRWPGQPRNVRSFLNPCLTEEELQRGAEAARRKSLDQPLRLLFVGRVESDKGVGICVELLSELNHAGVDAKLDLVGDGWERESFEQRVREKELNSKVSFQGELARNRLGEYYSNAHFIVLPSTTEGWPKVLSEAMAYGAVPIASAVGSIPEYLARFSTGQAISSRNPRSFADAIETYLHDPARWQEHSKNAVKAAEQFSYSHYLRAVRDLLDIPAAAEAVAA